MCKLTIAIPSLRLEKLSRLVQSIVAFTDGVDYEILVCGPYEIRGIQQLSDKVRFIQEKSSLGLCWAMQQILNMARGEWFVYFSDECIVTKGWAQAMLMRLESEFCDQICGSPRVAMLPEIVDGKMGNVYEMIPLTVTLGIYSIFPFMKTAYLRELGGFGHGYNTWFFDPDLGMRVWASGGQVVECQECVIVHENSLPTDEREKRVIERWKDDYDHFSNTWGVEVLFV